MTLDEQYIQIIDRQRENLANLQDAFNRLCESITAAATEKLATIPEENLPARQVVLENQKKELEKALGDFNLAVNDSQNKTRKQLEILQKQRENETLGNLETQILKI